MTDTDDRDWETVYEHAHADEGVIEATEDEIGQVTLQWRHPDGGKDRLLLTREEAVAVRDWLDGTLEDEN